MSFVEIYPEMIITKMHTYIYLHMYVCMFVSMFTEIDFITEKIENILNITCKESIKKIYNQQNTVQQLKWKSIVLITDKETGFHVRIAAIEQHI